MSAVSFESLVTFLGRNCSEADFSETLLKLIGEHEVWEDDGDTFYTGKTSGVEVLLDADGTVHAIFLFGPTAGGDSQYTGEVQPGLSFNLSRKQVRTIMGEPRESGEAEIYLGEKIFSWDKYRREGYSLHIEYADDERCVRQFTLGRSMDS
jgi:hypothetical protein